MNLCFDIVLNLIHFACILVCVQHSFEDVFNIFFTVVILL